MIVRTRKRIKVEILLPLNYNDGTPISDLTLVKIYDKIQDKFGAISKDSSLIEGFWQNPRTKVQYSDTFLHTIRLTQKAMAYN